MGAVAAPLSRPLVAAVFALALALPLSVPAGAIASGDAPGGGEPGHSEHSILVGVLTTRDVLPDGDATVAFVVRGAAASGSRDPLFIASSSHSAACSTLATQSESRCKEQVFTNAAGSVRSISILPTGFVGTVTVRILDPDTRATVASLECRILPGITDRVTPCSGERTFQSPLGKLLLGVTVNGTGLAWVEVK